MTTRFKFTASRIEEAATIPEYIGCLSGNLGSVLKLLPKMLIDDNGEYIVTVEQDQDGVITGYQNLDLASARMMDISAGKLKSLAKDLVTALGGVINPTSGSDLKKPLPTEPPQPPTG